MKKITFLTVIALIVMSLASCSGMVSYLVFSRDNDGEKFNKIYDVQADDEGERVIFYADEEIYNVVIKKTGYDEQSESFYDVEELFSLDVLKKGDGIRVQVDFSREIPDVKVNYERKNGEKREQYLYKNEQTGKLWLLEQSR